VVVPVEPEVPVGCDGEQREAEQRVGREVDRLGQLRAHPLLGRGPRVGRGADVHPSQLPATLRFDHLAWALG
jgi:hypothetical protein